MVAASASRAVAGGAERLRVELSGAVQGVGLRPSVYRLATELELAGQVLNDGRGAVVEVEGSRRRLEEFLARLPAGLPPLAIVLSTRTSWLVPRGYDGFSIHESDASGERSAVVLPDVATCADCLREVLDPADRRYRYPFTNCTNCGPRYSILRALPYDRPNTTMSAFEMCDRCRREYENPLDRRFHAQPNACPECGPRLSLLAPDGDRLAAEDRALEAAAEALLDGRIVAVKGLGGFHLMANAADPGAVRALRRRKRRPAKPLALMVGDLRQARRLCRVSAAAAELLASARAPIVLLPKLPGEEVAEEVAPGNPDLGVMLPSTPLHHLLTRAVEIPLVATSGNRSDEPICIDEAEALERLEGIADLFLVHDRPIVRPVDDSVLRDLGGSVLPVRRARGYAPLPVPFERPLPPVLAVGAHLKNVVALSVGGRVFMSQHIGDMETPQALAGFERTIGDLIDIYQARPRVVVCDLHPDYPSTHWLAAVRAGDGERPERGWLAAIRDARRIGVQHHHAHLAACLADNGSSGPALGVTWDGTGYGPDGTVWGGELLLGDAGGYERVASLRPFRLPGGDAAVLEPRRVALALLWELYGEELPARPELPAISAFTERERRPLLRMLERGFRAPLTTSAGRLFDGVAALLDLHRRVSFEGQAAMALEACADPSVRDAYPIEVVKTAAGGDLRGDAAAPDGSREPRMRLDWAPLVEAILGDLRRGVAAGRIAARFHNALAAAVSEVAAEVGQPTVALTGGCFQNRLLTERVRRRLEKGGFEVLVHRQVPPNDGSICLGQVAVGAAVCEREPLA